MTTARILRLATWPAALFIALTFLWYEQYKLTGNPGSVWLFQTLADWLGVSAHEKPFRLGVAIAELVASVLVVVPATRMIGAALSFGLMSGAIFFHVVSPLGIDPYQDGGGLFKEAVGVWVSSVFILYVLRDEAFALARRLGLPAPMPATP